MTFDALYNYNGAIEVIKLDNNHSDLVICIVRQDAKFGTWIRMSDNSANISMTVLYIQTKSVPFMPSVLLKGQQVFVKIFHNEIDNFCENELIQASNHIIATQNSEVNFFIK